GDRNAIRTLLPGLLQAFDSHPQSAAKTDRKSDVSFGDGACQMPDASVASSREHRQPEQRERIFKKQYERSRRVSTQNQNPSRRMPPTRDRTDLVKIDATPQRAEILEILFDRLAGALERSILPQKTGPHRIERCGVRYRRLMEMMLERAV